MVKGMLSGSPLIHNSKYPLTNPDNACNVPPSKRKFFQGTYFPGNPGSTVALAKAGGGTSLNHRDRENG
jgi:hypothetical protein